MTMTDKNSKLYKQYLKGLAKKALYKFGSGPLYEFVYETVIRIPTVGSVFATGQDVRQYVCEEIKFSSWIILNLIDFETAIIDLRHEADALLKKNAPVYFRLRIAGKRFVVAPDFDESESQDYETPMRWDNLEQLYLDIEKLKKQYELAKLPVPKIDIVNFNKDHQEVPK